MAERKRGVGELVDGYGGGGELAVQGGESGGSPSFAGESFGPPLAMTRV